MIPVEDIKNSYGVEMAVVVLTCRVHFKTATTEELQLFIDANEIDWKTVLTICRNHCIRPVAYKILIGLRIPGTIAAVIKEEYFIVIAKCWQHAIETERLITLLKEHNIQAVPYKGTAFSKQFYGDLVSRESTDIDLIIKPEDLGKAIPVFKADGYLPESELMYEFFGSKYFKYHKDFNFNKFRKREREFHIELHGRIIENSIGIAGKVNDLIYKECGKLVLINTELIVLNPNIHYMAVIIHHGIRDIFRSLKAVADISQLTTNNNNELNRELINEYVSSLHISKVFALGNIISEKVFGIAMVDNFNYKIPSKKVNYFISRLLSTTALNLHPLKSMMQYFIIHLYLCDSFTGKIKVISSFIQYRFVPSLIDIRIISLPKPLHFLYSIFKPLRSLVYRSTAMKEKQRLIPKE